MSAASRPSSGRTSWTFGRCDCTNECWSVIRCLSQEVHVLVITRLTYLSRFVERYGGRKLERARDLFEQALEKVPAKFARRLYMLYAKLEEWVLTSPLLLLAFVASWTGKAKSLEPVG